MSVLSSPETHGTLRRARPGVPWTTVLTLAAAMACASAFWLVALQGAVGATDRAQSPFATWLMLSIVGLPVFALAVLGSMALAMGWFGPLLDRPRSALATGLLVVAVGTLVGVLAIVASSAYDYHLQLHQISVMAGMRPCTGSCLVQEQHDILVLHGRAVLLVARWLLLTNVVLVAWLVAMWGGRLRVGTSPGSDVEDEAVVTLPRHGATRVHDLRLLLAGALVGTAVIHAAVITEHLSEWPAAGVFFLALALAETGVAALLLARHGARAVLLAAVGLSALPLALWVWSRTLGLPFGPEAGVPEAVALPDVLACVLEIAALLGALALLSARRLVGPPLSPHAKGLAVLALVAVTVVGLAATGPGWFDAFGVSAGRSLMDMSR